MDTNNELLLHIYETSDMGVKTLTKLLNILKKKDNKIKDKISDELKEYEEIFKKSKKILENNNIKKIGPNILTSITANATMSMEIDKDNSDSKVAEILIRGYSMGIIEMEKKIEDYKNTDIKINLLANKLLKFQKKAVEDLKKYL